MAPASGSNPQAPNRQAASDAFETAAEEDLTDASVPPSKRHNAIASRVFLERFHVLEERLRTIEDRIPAESGGETGPAVRTEAEDGVIDTVTTTDDVVTENAARPHKALDLFAHAKSFLGIWLDSLETLERLSNLRRMYPKSEPYRLVPSSIPRAQLGVEMQRLLSATKPSCDDILEEVLSFLYDCHPIFDHAEIIRAYVRYWALSPQNQSNDDFLPCLAMITVLHNIITDGLLTPRSRRAFGLVSEWCFSRNEKELKKQLVLQIKTLHVLGLHLSATAPSNSVYIAAGDLVRCARIAGLHKGHTENYEGLDSYRCRLWCSIVELDLQCSLVCGLPPAVRPDDYVPVPRTLSNRAHTEAYGLLRKTAAIRAEFTHDLDLDLHSYDALALGQKLGALVNAEKRCLPFPDIGTAVPQMYIHRSIVLIARHFLGTTITSDVHQSLLKSCLNVLGRLEVQRGVKPNFCYAYREAFHKEILTALQIIAFIRRALPSSFIDGVTGEHGFTANKNRDLALIAGDVLRDHIIPHCSHAVIGDNLKDIVALAVLLADVRTRGTVYVPDQAFLDFVRAQSGALDSTMERLSQRFRNNPVNTIVRSVGNGAEDFDIDLDLEQSVDQAYDWDIIEYDFDFKFEY